MLIRQIKSNALNNTEDLNNQIFVNNIQDLQLLKERISVFLAKSTLLFYSHLFDMAIQKQEEFKSFGQSNYAMRKMNHLFKVDKKLLSVDAKSSINRSSSASDDSKLFN